MEIVHPPSFVRFLKYRWVSCPAFQPPILGCTDSEIEQLLIAQKVARLPELYSEFMRQMGREDGGLGKFRGSYLNYLYVLTFKSEPIGYCLPLLKAFNVDQESFVFLSDNANFLMFFDTRDMSDDPVVYNIHEGTQAEQPYVKVEAGRLSVVLVDLVESCFLGFDQ